MLVCADQELCKLPNRPLGEKDGHQCRLGCGGRLHGICGEPEEEGGHEIHRVCNPCIAKKQKTPGSSIQEKVKNTFKEDENISDDDDDDELDTGKDSESAGGDGKKAPPSCAELAEFFFWSSRTIRRVVWHW